jgi:fructokinase
MSALLAGLHERGLLGAAARPALRGIAGGELHAVLATAATAAAIVCGRRGSDPPTRAELDALVVTR